MTRPRNPLRNMLGELRRIAGAMNAGAEERAMREEMRFHLDMHAAKLCEQGIGEDESRRRAALAFGGAQWVEAARDEYRSRRGLALSAAGALGGTVVSLIVLRFLRAFLFEVTPMDPVTLAGGILVLTACAFTASWIPARRAARLDPARALRVD